MSDPEVIQKNLLAFEQGLKKRGVLKGEPSEILKYVNNVLREYGESIEFTLSKATSQAKSNRSENQIEYRLRALESKVDWLLEKKIDEESESIINIIKDEFMKIPFIKAVYISRMPSGYDLLVVHESDTSDKALSAIIKAKINIRKQLMGSVFLELSVLRSSDFRKEEWTNKELLLTR